MNMQPYAHTKGSLKQKGQTENEKQAIRTKELTDGAIGGAFIGAAGGGLGGPFVGAAAGATVTFAG